MLEFMFATGIENSEPTVRGGAHRVDQLELCGHYRHWRTDFDRVQELGVRFLRYGPSLYRTWVGPERYDWSFADQAFAELRRRGITPIVDLCHFGLPDWLGNFQNPDFPGQFACYARAFAERFDWVRLYTPVNEMLICALFSGRHGWWNEQLATDRGFVTALKHLVKANVLAMAAIAEVRPDAIFIQSESSELTHPASPDAVAVSNFANRLRFVSLDLNYGRHVDAEVYEYLLDNGLTREEYAFFMDPSRKHHCVMGNDYYETNEHWISADATLSPAGDLCGYDDITRQYFERYRLPVMHTETNLSEGDAGTEAVEWLRRQWANILRLRGYGVPIIGFTWYSLTDQIDWDTALREPNGTVNPLGLYDLDRNIRAVGRAYKQLIADWREVMSTRTALVTAIWFPGGQAP